MADGPNEIEKMDIEHRTHVHNQALAAIKARENEVKSMLLDKSAVVINVPPQFYGNQIGVTPVVAGPDGRLWACRGDHLVLVFDRNWSVDPFPRLYAGKGP